MHCHEREKWEYVPGFRVSNHTFNCLIMRYSGPQGKIYFDDYILCAARLKTMFGFRVSNHTFNCLVMRYSGPQGKIYFNDYVLCAARLKTMFANYTDAGGKGNQDASFGMDQFIQTTMYS